MCENPHGIMTVLVTPFNDDAELSVDYEAIERWLKIQINNKVNGLVLLGTTSESATLNENEQYGIVTFIHNTLKEFNYSFKCGIYVGLGGIKRDEILNFALKCKDYCDGFMLSPPPYVKPTQEGIVEHYKYIFNNDALKEHKMIIYNVPGRTSVLIEVGTIKKIFEECSNVVALKDATGNIDQLMETRTQVPDLIVMAGDDKYILDFMIHGGKGVISVMSNVYPELLIQLFDGYESLNVHDVGQRYYKLNIPTIVKLLFIESNPIPVKYMLYRLGVYKNYNMRCPMTKLNDKYVEKLNDVLSKIEK